MATQKKIYSVWASAGSKTDPDTPTTVTNYEQGWREEIPTYQEFNYVLNKIDNNISVIAERGYFDWDAKVTYQPGAVVRVSNIKYYCVLGNININPISDTENLRWKKAPNYGFHENTHSVDVSRTNNKVGLSTFYLFPERVGHWDGSDIAIFNACPTVLFAADIASERRPNVALSLVGPDLFVTKVEGWNGDGREVGFGKANSFKLMHEGNVSSVSLKNPTDGFTYGRKNETWVKIEDTSVTLNPEDGKQYVRKDDGWVVLTKASIATLADWAKVHTTRTQAEKDAYSKDYLTVETLHKANIVYDIPYIELTFAKKTDITNFLTINVADGKQYVRKGSDWVELTKATKNTIANWAKPEADKTVEEKKDHDDNYITTKALAESGVFYDRVYIDAIKANKTELLPKLDKNPEDGKQYVRKDGAWLKLNPAVPSEIADWHKTSAQRNAAQQERHTNNYLTSKGLRDANVLYDRTQSDATFATKTEVANLTPKNPEDGKPYIRRNGQWEELELATGHDLINWGATSRTEIQRRRYENAYVTVKSIVDANVLHTKSHIDATFATIAWVTAELAKKVDQTTPSASDQAASLRKNDSWKDLQQANSGDV